MEPHFLNGMGFLFLRPRVKRGKGAQSIICPPKVSSSSKYKKIKELNESFPWHMDCCLKVRGEVLFVICQSLFPIEGEKYPETKNLDPYFLGGNGCISV